LVQGGLGLLGPLPLPVLGLLNAVDCVELEASGLLSGPLHLVARLKQEPDFDRVKVDSIKDAIANGQYPLNPRRIAESFVALEQMISN
jgi:hypothetical protein